MSLREAIKEKPCRLLTSCIDSMLVCQRKFRLLW